MTSQSRRLLIVSSHFPPDRSAGTHRILRFANDFQRSGWSTVVLTIDPASYRHNIPLDPGLCGRADAALTVATTGAFRGLTLLTKARRALSGGHVGRAAGDRGRDAGGRERQYRPFDRARRIANNFFSFPDDEVGWLVPAAVRGLQLVRQHSIDVVLSSAPAFTCHLVARALKGASGVKWAADFRDPWSRAPWGKPGSVRAHRWLEAMTVRGADAVILNTPELRDDFAGAYGEDVARKLYVVTNGYEADVLEPYASQQPGGTPPVLLTHAGTLYGTRDPVPLLEALAKCYSEDRIPPNGVRLQLVGKIAGQFNVTAAIQRLGLDHSVVLTPPVSHTECLELLAASHALVVIQPGTVLQVPAKLYEYIGLRRPILALADEGAVPRVVREAEAGVCAPPRDVNAIANALSKLYTRVTKDGGRTAQGGRRTVFDARHQFDLMKQVVEGLVATAATPPRPLYSVQQ